MIFRPAALSARPVSVRSTMQSAISGTFASVAPYERRMSASMPFFSKNRRVRPGYSVATRKPCGRSSTRSIGESAPIATTMRTGRALAFEYSSSPSETTSAAVSSIQSRPVTPRSNIPSAT